MEPLPFVWNLPLLHVRDTRLNPFMDTSLNMHSLDFFDQETVDIVNSINNVTRTLGAPPQKLSSNEVEMSLIEATPALVKCLKAAMANGMAEALNKPEPVQFDPTDDDPDVDSTEDTYTRFTNCFYEVMKSTAKQMLLDVVGHNN